MAVTLRVAIGLSLLAALSASRPALAETFLRSDEYEERDGGPIGVFLGDEDYAVMFEDLERNDTTFDWGWVKTDAPDCAAPPAAPQGGRLNRLAGKLRRPRCRPSTTLAFDLRSAGTVHVPAVENYSGLIKPELLEEVHESFLAAAAALGLQAVEEREDAALALEVAVIDQMRSDVKIPIYGITIDPFISLELRLVNVHSGEKLLLVRNRKHGDDVNQAAFNFADDLVKFMR